MQIYGRLEALNNNLKNKIESINNSAHDVQLATCAARVANGKINLI